jgi:hypothetical protein
MPNDAPDWSITNATPAIDLGAFTVGAGVLQTVYDSVTPPGTHALKIYLQSNSVTMTALGVTVYDGTSGQIIQGFSVPVSTNLVVALDDVTVPRVKVTVTGATGAGTTGRVVAFLSDQAVFIDNDVGDPIPVLITSVGSAVGASGNSVPVAIGPRGIPFISQSGLNLAQTQSFLAPGGSAFNRLSQLVVTWSGATAGAPSVMVTDSAATVLWQAVVSVPAAGYQPSPFTFPVPLTVATGTGAMSITVAAAGMAGIASILSGVYSQY